MTFGNGWFYGFVFGLVLFAPLLCSAQTANPATAMFLSQDSATQGSWAGVYGADGYSLSDGTQKLPAYATLSVQGQTDYIWAASTTDVRALTDGTVRVASTWYALQSFSFDLNITDANSHQFAIYAVDWDSTARAESIQISDASSSTVLDTRNISSFSGGVYLTWNISGHVKVTITQTQGANAVISGVFFDKPVPPWLSLGLLLSGWSVDQTALAGFRGCTIGDTACSMNVSICDEQQRCLTYSPGAHSFTVYFQKTEGTTTPIVQTKAATANVQVTAQ